MALVMNKSAVTANTVTANDPLKFVGLKAFHHRLRTKARALYLSRAHITEHFSKMVKAILAR